MIDCTRCHNEFRKRLNRRNTSYSSRVSTAQADDYINEGYRFWFRYMSKLAETDSYARNALRQVEKKNVKLSLDCKQNYSKATLPSDYYSKLNYLIYAEKEGCNDCPKLLEFTSVQSDDLVVALNDPSRVPSFEYGETLIDEAGNEIFIYTDGSFTISKVLLSYLKQPTEIACPKLAEGGFYVDHGGNKVTKNVGLEIDSTTDWDDIIDLAVYFWLRDTSDNIEMDTQLNKILTKFKLKN